MTEPYKLPEFGASIHVGYRSYDFGSEHVEYIQVVFVNEAVRSPIIGIKRPNRQDLLS